MNFTERINADIKSAMLAKEKERLAALRDIKSKLLLEATSGGDSEVSDATAAKIVMKMHKQRMDTYTLYIEQGREDLAADELFEAKVIEEYMPKMLSEDEVRAEVQGARRRVHQLGHAGQQDAPRERAVPVRLPHPPARRGHAGRLQGQRRPPELHDPQKPRAAAR